MATEGKESLIYIDDLTGLFNRRYLYSELPRELASAKAEKYNLWLFMMDIDDFKRINDTYGHLSGDKVIKDVARILEETTKTKDKKIRYAGDEFTIIMTDIEAKDVFSVAKRMLVGIDTYNFKEKYSNKKIHLTVSMGIANYPQDTADPTELINLADKALYVSKQKGKNTISSTSDITVGLSWRKDILDKFPCPVYIGREQELAALKASLHKVAEPKTSLTLLSGTLGMGKSRILSEFERFASSQGITCLSPKCAEKFIAQPYYIWGEALDEYLYNMNNLPPHCLEGIVANELTALYNFLPILKNFSGLPKAESTAGTDENFLRTALIKFVRNISSIKPLCIMLDDVQYADEQTLDVIRRLTKEDTQLPLLVIASFTPGDLSIPGIGPSPFKKAKPVFEQYSETITLKGLSVDGVKEMISRLLVNVPVTDEFVTLIHETTKGNPLFVQEMLKYLIEKEYILYENGKWKQKDISEVTSPSSVRETIKARLESLDEETREMIAKAAVIGDNFRVDMLQKIDSQDRGYILDLIEAAKKVGLIYESEAGGKDEFKFVTKEIRNALFDLMGGTRTKHLYSRFGEMQERLYADRVDSIAGELYYNFKKAEDRSRIEQYSKVIKGGGSALYDRTVKYAHELLEEGIEEKALVPLGKKAWVIVPEIIRGLYIASVNFILYPPQNRMRMQSVENVYQKISMILSEIPTLNIACFESSVIVNNTRVGRELKSFFSNVFVALFKNLDLVSITFKRGMDKRELTTLTELISNTERKGSLSEALKKAGVTHIKVNEIRYHMSLKKSKEREGLQEIMLIDYLLGRFTPGKEGQKGVAPGPSSQQAIAQALETIGEQVSKKSGKDKETVKAEVMAKTVQMMGKQFMKKGKDAWEQHKENLAKTLISMEPKLRSEILSTQLKGKDKVDILKELAPAFPPDVVMDILTRQYLKKGSSLAEVRMMLQRFLSDTEKKEAALPLLKERLREAGASEEECDWICDGQVLKGESAEEKVNKFLSLPAEVLLKVLPVMELGPLLGELLSKKQDASVEAMMEKLFAALESGQIKDQVVVTHFKDLLENAIKHSPYGLLPRFIKAFLAVCLKHNKLLSVFVPVVNPHLNEIANIALRTKRFGLLKEILLAYTRDPQVIGESSSVLKPIAELLTEELIREIYNNDDWSELAEVIILLKDQTAALLVQKTLFEKGIPDGKYFEAYMIRRTIGKVLDYMPKEVLLTTLKEKFADPRLFISKNLIELIGAMESDESSSILEIPIVHPEVTIRRKVLFALRKKGGEQSARLLVKLLKDNDADIRREALRILKRRGDDISKRLLEECRRDRELPDDIRRAL